MYITRIYILYDDYLSYDLFMLRVRLNLIFVIRCVWLSRVELRNRYAIIIIIIILIVYRYNVEEMYTDTSVKSKLIISKVSAADSGRYVCVAENSLGKHEAAMELEIKGRQNVTFLGDSFSSSRQNYLQINLQF